MIAVALVPVVGSVVRLTVDGWIPEGDDAMIARRSMSVLSTDPPLTGQPSTASSLFAETDGVAVSASHPVPPSTGSWPSPTGPWAGRPPDCWWP